MDGLPHLDAFLELRLLELDADTLLQLIDIAKRVEAQHRDRTAVRFPDTLDALQRRGLAGAVRSDQAEDFAILNVERDLIDGDGPSVGLADAGDADHGSRHGTS